MHRWPLELPENAKKAKTQITHTCWNTAGTPHKYTNKTNANANANATEHHAKQTEQLAPSR